MSPNDSPRRPCLAKPRCGQRIGQALAVAGIVVMLTATGRGQNLDAIVLPRPGKAATHGLTMAIESHWVDSGGYRPIWVTLSTANGKPAKADRVLTVDLAVRFDWFDQAEQEVSAVVELPQGAVSTTVEIPFPVSQPWRSLKVTTYEAGGELVELSYDRGQLPAMVNKRQALSEGFPSILIIDADVPDRALRTAWYAAQLTKIQAEKKPSPIPDLRVLINEIGGVTMPGFVNTAFNGGGTGFEVIGLLETLNRIEIL
ncbi:MAG: hypothetical protein ACIALR_16890, partial [Blastopirellula sp. JB062]